MHKALQPTWEPSASPARRLAMRLILSLVLAAVSLLAREAVAQQTPRSVVLIDAFKFPAKSTQAHHSRLRAGMEDALTRDGWTVAQAPAVADCGATPECLANIARESGAGYLVRISGERSQSSEYGYEASLDLYSVAGGDVRSRNLSCDICDSKRVSEIAGKAAVDLLAKAVKEDAEVAARSTRLAPPPVAAVPPSSGGELVTPPNATAPPSHVSWVPWTLIGVGAAGIVYGGWALYKNGDSSGSPYLGAVPGHDTYSSKALGIGTLVGGGALAVVGVTWLIVNRFGSAAVSASPNHVALDLRF